VQTPLKNKLFTAKQFALRQKRRCKVVSSRLSRRDRRIERLEARIKQLEQRLEPRRVANYHYPLQIILIAVFMVVQAQGSLRCAAKTVGFVSKLLGWDYGIPSAATVRNWVLKIGHYALHHPQVLRGDFSLILDESIQIGGEKLLLMLGLPLPANSCYSEAITMEQVCVLGLEVQRSWTAEAIVEFYHSTLSRYLDIKVLHLICDQGTNLLAAMRQLGLSWVSDCSHVMMNAAKTIFAEDTKLSELCAQVGRLRRQVLLGEWGFLAPPTLRDKDRFHRVFDLVAWLDRLKSYGNQLPAAGRAKLCFLLPHHWLIKRLRQVHDLMAISARILKRRGLSQWSYQRWKAAVQTYLGGQAQVTAAARRFVSIIDQYFQDHRHLYADQDQVICCSDIIESMFGRYKNKGGVKVISADVLSIALYGRELNPDWVVTALEATTEQHVIDWQNRYTSDNRYSILRRMARELKTDTA
jgi:hypothetical protein